MLEQAAQIVSEKLDSDLLVYSGQVTRAGYENLSDVIEDSKTKSNALLLLSTYGGSPDAGYRIARAIRHHYHEFRVLISGICKSAGTLVVLGADELIISDRGELGPLDVQISKPDEMFEFGSGLDLMQSLALMQEQAMAAFRSYLWEIKTGSGITTKSSAEMSTKLAIGLFSPVYQQLDPIRLGEVQRAMMIAYAYGNRLDGYSSNLTDGALQKLVTNYPSHGFVIDRKEARELFRNVRIPEPMEELLGRLIYKKFSPDQNQPNVFNILRELARDDTEEQQCNETESNDIAANRIEESNPTGERVNESDGESSDFSAAISL